MTNPAPRSGRLAREGPEWTSAGILSHRLETDYGPRAFAVRQILPVAARPRSKWSLMADGESVRAHWSLVGTLRNCAGGLTPWGSWLSCEESLESSSATGFEQNHGYIFEVPIDTDPGTPTPPVALRHLGRFAHEAVAVDPATGAVYETEDQGDGSGFFRYVPSVKPRQPGDLAASTGVLQMLKVVGTTGYETAINQTVGVPLPVEWVTITNPDPVPVSVVVSGQTLSAVFVEGLAAGGATVPPARRMLVRESGGSSSSRPTAATWGSARCGNTTSGVRLLTLLVESPNHDVFDGPDNVCISSERRPGLLRGRGWRAASARGLAIRSRVPSRAKSAQQHRVRRRLLQPGREDAVRESLWAEHGADHAAVPRARSRFRSVRRSTSGPRPSRYGGRGDPGPL